ncbi:MAG: (d)CMP kinase [Ruminococcaceae bacterium]|nr:(d)CMP kinase [Oscillospiraceae bacterium]
MKIRIAIDGPSGSGKSTLAKNIAKTLGLVYVDTGALYRTVGLYAKRCGVAIEDASKVTRFLPEAQISIRYTEEGQRVILNGEDVSDLIRTPEMSMYASAVSAVSPVRTFLLEIQKRMAAEGGVVMDGRDIGTVIMPDADVKLFVEASPKARARRRFEELQAKGDTSTEKEVLDDIIKRDSNDKNRAVAPAIPADDAIFIDNSDMTPEETLAHSLKIIKTKLCRTL